VAVISGGKTRKAYIRNTWFATPDGKPTAILRRARPVPGPANDYPECTESNNHGEIEKIRSCKIGGN
jgi:hypothetical protein